MEKKQTPLQKNILALFLMLLSLGLVMIYSSSAIVAGTDIGNPYFFIKKQLIWTMLAGAAMLACMDLPYRFFARHAYLIFVLALLGVAVVLIPGIGVKYFGARRWIRVAGMGVQPSELMKLACVLFIARYCERNYSRLKNFYLGFCPVFVPIAFVCFLILLEPDFGTSCFIMAIGVALLLVSGIRWQHLVPVFLAGLPIVLFLVIFKFHHIHSRIKIYLDPDLDPLGKGYQIRQSLIALGSGGTLGMGPGWGQQKLFFLSEESTDFIFAIIGEELGFIGVALIISLYILFIYYGLQVVRRAPDIFSTLVALGITLTIGLQTIFNIAVVTHTIPAKGISLPFISFGGSGLFFTTISVGILLNIAGYCHEPPANKIEAKNKFTTTPPTR